MVHQYGPDFPPKVNEDGSFNSFCADCHMMVVTSRNEAALIYLETSHKCDSVRLYQVVNLVKPSLWTGPLADSLVFDRLLPRARTAGANGSKLTIFPN
jgi:hypothetical protein